jgi:hypothetical protein
VGDLTLIIDRLFKHRHARDALRSHRMRPERENLKCSDLRNPGPE